LRNISPKCCRSLPYNTFRRHFGVNKMLFFLHAIPPGTIGIDGSKKGYLTPIDGVSAFEP
jgi:hypothetical protein